jgi:hypothetical protein
LRGRSGRTLRGRVINTLDPRLSYILMAMKYSITLTVDKTVYKGEGETMYSALLDIKRPVKIFNKGVITLKAGDKEKVIPMTAQMIKRMFYPITQVMTAKNWDFLLKA